MKFCFILGTRPEIIKMYSCIKYCSENKLDFFIIHTNQHYSENMDKIFFNELDLPQPKYNLNIGSGSHGNQTGRMLIEIEKVLLEEKPGIVLVQGDTNTVVAGALAASKLGIKIGHIEAGLRSYDKEMPEETNRIITDHISDYLFCPTDKQKAILLNEGIPSDKIFVTGNTIVDIVLSCAKIAEKKSNILKRLNIEKDKYFLLTCHRPSNTENEKGFYEIMKTIQSICEEEKSICIFPLHPRLNGRIDQIKKYKNIKVIDPIGYLDSIKLQNNSKMIFTDSGGIQEESCILKKKCVILRENTERPETLNVGGAMLVKQLNGKNIINTYKKLKIKEVKWKNPFGDGNSNEKIFQKLDI